MNCITLGDFNLVKDWVEGIKNLEPRLSNNFLVPLAAIVCFWVGVGEELLSILFLFGCVTAVTRKVL